MTTSGITVSANHPAQSCAAGESPWTMPSPHRLCGAGFGDPPAFHPNSCAITEIGAVRVREGHIVDQFQQLVNPLRPIPRQISHADRHHRCEWWPISIRLTRCFPDSSHGSLAPAAGPAVEPIVGHNVSFDLRFLDYNTRHIAGCGFACADYDTMQISRALFPAQRHHRLADLIVRFGIADNEEHRALSDAIQTQQCFEWMRHYVTEHHETEAIRWKQAPAEKTAPKSSTSSWW